jgi:DNA mismatch endonuclease (patch repair protein)
MARRASGYARQKRRSACDAIDDARTYPNDSRCIAGHLAGDRSTEQSHSISRDSRLSGTSRGSAPKCLTNSVDPTRSAQMALVRSKNTEPEFAVRRLVHALGCRFRLHRRDLPGTPDLVLPRRRKIIFVHGCFWHRHNDPACWRSRLPKSRPEFWAPKLEANVARDAAARSELRHLNWDVFIAWECETKPKRIKDLAQKMAAFLNTP